VSLPRLLIVEDEPDLIRSLEFAFRGAGFEVQSTTRGRDALALIEARAPDLVLLDIMLPDIEGTEVCRQLKGDAKTSAIPVIMVTARADEIDRVVGFELGADDYVVKPFSVRELILRAKAVLRRKGPADAPATLAVGPLTIDTDAHRVWVEGKEVTLTAREFRLLFTIASRQGRVQTRDTLLSEVWGLSLHVETRTVDTHVKRLREKLGSAGALIQTVRGVGYRFTPSDQAD
jgi:two-component system, OmpR family, phosphate regulon response regulator PhoB